MPLRIGETFAGYRVLRLLGSGGMGEVYLVQHPRLPRHEALKVLRPDISSEPSFRERFIREADLAAGLRHPSIVGIHDRGENDGQLWIAMDYIEGTDLSRLLKQRYPAGMPVGHVLPIVSAVASALDYAHKTSALDYAHKKALLHRDVKPANIIVADLDTADPSVLLADFGIARPLDDTSGITTANMTVGTVAYAAPEQLMGLSLDGRADQYALAVTAYELLTGLLPFEHSNPVVIASHKLNASAPPLSRLRPELADLDPVLAIALAKEPGERFSTSIDFAHALASAGAKGGAPNTSSRPTFAAPTAGKRHFSGAAEERPSPFATRKTSTDHLPSRPIEVHEPRPRWPVIASTLAMVVLLAAVAVVLVVGPWDHDGASDETTGTPPVIAPSMTFEAMRDFVTAYYADLPARPEAAWAKVTPDGRNETGHDKFVDFWSRIQSVTLISISPRDATSVVARLRYSRKDGGGDTEDRWLRMVVVNSAIQLQESGRIGPASDPPTPISDPAFSPKNIDQLLLTADQLSNILGVDVTDSPSGSGAGDLALKSSSYGTSDHAGQVTPPSCVGVIFTGEHEVYGGIGHAGIKTQTYGDFYASGDSGPYLLFQTAVVFSTADEAQAFLNTSQTQWVACAAGDVDVTLGYENGRRYTLGSVQSDENLITVAMASYGGLNGPDACQQALGLRENVIVEARTCEVPNVTGPPGKGDPDWAVPDAERVATAMLENVTP